MVVGATVVVVVVIVVVVVGIGFPASTIFHRSTVVSLPRAIKVIVYRLSMFDGFAEMLAVRAISPVLHLTVASNLAIRGFDVQTQVFASFTAAKTVLEPPKELILMVFSVCGVFDAPAETRVRPAAPRVAQATTRAIRVLRNTTFSTKRRLHLHWTAR